MKLTPWILIAFAAPAMPLPSASAAPTPWWFDGYDITAPPTNDINTELGPARQGGVIGATPYLSNSSMPETSFYEQIQSFGGGGILQLAGDLNQLNTVVSPNFNFKGVIGDQAIGRKISVVVDPATTGGNLPGMYTTAAVTVGSSIPNAPAQTKADGFSVVFVEDRLDDVANPNTPVSFIQIYDGSTLIAPMILNPAGVFGGALELFLNDPLDGDPFNGVGSTVVDVVINGQPLLTGWTKPGGYAENFITLEGGSQTAGGLSSTGVHTFDNLTVFTDTVIPEPTTATLLALAAAGLACRPRR